jgi:hypothetical protein
MKQIQISSQKSAARSFDEHEVRLRIRAALKSMRNQEIPITGPFRTAKGLIVVATGKFVLTGDELIELMERERLDATGIEALVGTLKVAVPSTPRLGERSH